VADPDRKVVLEPGTPAGSWHVLRSWNPPDPFAPACGCEVAPCSFVVARPGCDQHDPMACRIIRNGHAASDCWAAAGSATPTGDDDE
jgi:hypothetical protein